MFFQALQAIFNRAKAQPLFYIVLIICAANWQLLFGIRSLQWDVTNFWAPWRYYISECYNNGFVPLWDPFAQAGYPVHGDLQGPAYSPEAILSSFVFPASMYFFNLLYLAYLVLGSYGFYKLSISVLSKVKLKDGSTLSTDAFNKVGILSALVYALSGYNVAHGHYLYITISVALLPWIYYYFIQLFSGGTYKDAIKLAIFIFWQVTAGNPSFLIVTGYFLVIIAAMRFVYLIREKRNPEIFHFLKTTSFAFVLAVVLSLPVFINAYLVFPDTSRFGGIKMSFAGEENFVFPNFFTFFTSLISYERDLKLGNHQPVFNHYIGLFTLFFSCIGIVKFRSFWLRAFLVIAAIAMLLSFGLETPVYGLFYKYLPFISVFRMPRLVFIHVLVLALLLFSCGLAYYLQKGMKIKPVIIYIATALCISLASVLYFKFAYHELKTGYETDTDNLRAFLWTSSQPVKAIISCIINIGLVILAWRFFKNGQSRKLMFLLLFDVVLNYNLGSICRNFSEDKLSFSSSYLQGLPKGFPVPANIPAKKIDMITGHFNEFWKNIPIYLKQPYYGNDNSFELTRYMDLFEFRRDEYNYWLTLPQAFFADSLVPKFDAATAPYSTKRMAVVDPASWPELKNLKLSQASENNITCTQFDPDRIKYQVDCKQQSAFATQQNYTRLWKVTVNGVPAKVHYCFGSFPLIIIPPGKHVIGFSYEVPYFYPAFLVSCLLFVVLVVVLFLDVKNRKLRLGFISLFCLLILFCSFRFISGKSRNIQESYAAAFSALGEYTDGIAAVNGQDEIAAYLKPGMNSFNLLFREDVAELCSLLRTTKANKFSLLDYGAYHSAEVEMQIRYYFGNPVSTRKLDFGNITVYERNPQSGMLKYENTLDIEKTECDCKMKDSISGMVRLRVDKAHEFSKGFEFTLRDANAACYDLVEAECSLETGFPDFIGLCMSVERKGVIKKFLTYNYVHYPGKAKQKINIAYRLPGWVKKDDLVKVYVWNNSDTPVYLEALRVKVLKGQ